MQSILILTYKFPPMGGIGTRRWTKFAKYLSNKGYDVHVLKAEYQFTDKINWQYDISENIHVHTFKSKYPQWLLSESSDNIIKQVKRYSNFILGKTFFDLDIAQYDAKAILTKAKSLINEYNIINIIATGHPVSMHYISTYLKIDSPKLNLIQDYRDNWNDLNVYHYGNKEGFKSFRQKEKSAYKEFFTLMYSDYIVNVSDDLTSQLQMKHKNLNTLHTITNGFDVDDMRNIQYSNDSFDMVYAGSLFNGRIEAIKLLLDAMLLLNDEYVNTNFKLVVYSNFNVANLDKKYNVLLGKNIVFKSFIPPDKIIDIVAKYRYTLSINSKFASYAFGTKIFDYMALNKKILHISNGGALYDVLQEKEQFVSTYNMDRMQEVLLQMKNEYLENNTHVNIDYSDFSLDNIVLKFEKLFRWDDT